MGAAVRSRCTGGEAASSVHGIVPRRLAAISVRSAQSQTRTVSKRASATTPVIAAGDEICYSRARVKLEDHFGSRRAPSNPLVLRIWNPGPYQQNAAPQGLHRSWQPASDACEVRKNDLAANAALWDSGRVYAPHTALRRQP